jgi:RNA polymerase sigma factor (sigma-70 family)
LTREKEATSLTNSAETCHDKGGNKDAELLLKRSLQISRFLEIIEKALGPEHSDVLLVKRLVRREQAAIVMFYEQYKNLIYGTIRKDSFAQEHEIEDYFNNFWVRLMENDCRRLTLWKGNCRLSTYLVSMLKNFFKDEGRKYRPMEVLSAKDDVGEDPRDDIVHSIFTKEVRPYFRNCLKSLSERDREIINRAFIKDESVDEIAEALGMTNATYYKALHDAKKRLKKCVKVEFPFLLEDDL